MSVYKAMYIWLDGSEPTPRLRSKTKIIKAGDKPPIWGFDGSSTNQAPGENSDCVLKPAFTCADPIRGGNDILVVCEVLLPDLTPHPTNTRAAMAALEAKHQSAEMWFAFEQEYTFMQAGRPLGFPDEGYPAPQGPYYCSVGDGNVTGREIVEAHLEACLEVGLTISGTNAEVMLGQWEFQLGPCAATEASDQLVTARWLLHRIAEDYGVQVSLHPKPMKGDWNGAGCHTNFSSKAMREGWEPIIAAAEALGERAALHVRHYGAFVDERLTGLHETCPYTEFRYGVSDRGASVRIPWQVAVDKKGYLEDRRPNSNCDPYVVARLITEAVLEG